MEGCLLNTRMVCRPAAVGVSLLLVACASAPSPPGAGHLAGAGIPTVVQPPGFIPTPPPIVEPARYSLSVEQVPVREILYALAKDAGLDLDVHPEVAGTVSLHAIDAPLPGLLERIARQASLRYEPHDTHLEVLPDQPHVRTYRIDYPDLVRGASSQSRIGTKGGSAGVAGSETTDENHSSTDILAESSYDFWETLAGNLDTLLNGEGEVIAHPTAGIVAVRTTMRRHQLVQEHLAEVLHSAHRQVLIRATVVEVTLDHRFQAGIDWSLLDGDLRWTLLPGAPARAFSALSADLGGGSLNVMLRLLEEFGETRVLSSPQLMALNHQAALLKVVDNLVYFTLEQQSTISVQGSSELSSRSEVHTVPVGLVMSITPQIDADGNVLLLVRPSISRVNRFVEDPNPAIADGVNRVPEVQVRELESLLRLRAGEIAVLGGLTRDESLADRASLPGLSSVLTGSRTRESRRTELVVLLRPVPVPAPTPRPVAAVGHDALSLVAATGHRQVAAWLNEAQRAWQDGAPESAQRLWQRVTTVDADNRHALYGLAAAAVKRGARAYARTLYRRLTALDPSEVMAQAMLAESSAALQRILSSSAPPQAYFMLGNLYASEQRWPEALQAYLDALDEGAPRAGECAFNAAVALEHVGEHAAALDHYRLALRLGPARQGFSAMVAEARIAALQVAAP